MTRTNTGVSGSGVNIHLDQASLGSVPSNMSVELSFGNVNGATASGAQQTIYLGLLDAPSGTAGPGDGIFFRYSRTTTAGNWERCVANDTVLNCADTGIAYSTTMSNYQSFRIVTNATSSVISYFIDDVSAGTLTTGFPDTTDSFGPPGRSLYYQWHCQGLEARLLPDNA